MPRELTERAWTIHVDKDDEGLFADVDGEVIEADDIHELLKKVAEHIEES